jgi:hypothetical protein
MRLAGGFRFCESCLWVTAALGALAVFSAAFVGKLCFLHLDHAYLHIVFDILLAFAATGCSRRGHKTGKGNVFTAFLTAARAAVAQQAHKALEFLNALRAAAGAAMGYVGRLKMAGRVQFVRAVMRLKNVAQLGETVHFFIQFTL